MSNLYAASQQWSTRPADERYSSLEEMLSACRYYRSSAKEAVVDLNSLEVHAGLGDNQGELYIQGKAGTPARLTHWSFGQLCRNVSAPADYLRRLPSDLAATNLNAGLREDKDQANLLIHRNGDLVLRCMTTDKYTRIWNDDVISRMLDFKHYGWKVPPARPAFPDQPGTRIATEEDVLDSQGHGLSIKVGDTIAPAGLYASDHDCFIFMVNEQKRIQDGSEGGLSRGFFLSNSEVGAAALKVTSFMYRHVCGNHIVWGAENARTIKIVHRGAADRRFHSELVAELSDYCERSASQDEQVIHNAKSLVLGSNKEEVLDAMFKALRGDLSRKTMNAAYDQVEEDSRTDLALNPHTIWGQVQGLTAYSRQLAFADERSKIDMAAGKLMSLAF